MLCSNLFNNFFDVCCIKVHAGHIWPSCRRFATAGLYTFRVHLFKILPFHSMGCLDVIQGYSDSALATRFCDLICDTGVKNSVLQCTVQANTKEVFLKVRQKYTLRIRIYFSFSVTFHTKRHSSKVNKQRFYRALNLFIALSVIKVDRLIGVHFGHLNPDSKLCCKCKSPLRQDESAVRGPGVYRGCSQALAYGEGAAVLWPPLRP